MVLLIQWCAWWACHSQWEIHMNLAAVRRITEAFKTLAFCGKVKLSSNRWLHLFETDTKRIWRHHQTMRPLGPTKSQLMSQSTQQLAGLCLQTLWRVSSSVVMSKKLKARIQLNTHRSVLNRNVIYQGGCVTGASAVWLAPRPEMHCLRQCMELMRLWTQDSWVSSIAVLLKRALTSFQHHKWQGVLLSWLSELMKILSWTTEDSVRIPIAEKARQNLLLNLHLTSAGLSITQ